MQKDVVYIDTEDDITAIIGKVKASKSKIVALVPPKRVGAIQSAVNLKLVHRATEAADKRLVIISNNHGLMALAGSVGIPTAKNLQSRPEIAEIPALDIDDGEDIIDGAELPIGEHVAQGTSRRDQDTAGKSRSVSSSKPDDSENDEQGDADDSSSAATAPAAANRAADKSKSKPSVPNFDKFRKKLVFIILAAILLIGLLVWAIFFAGSAKIVVTARTADAALSTSVTLDPSGDTNLKSGTIKPVVKTAKKDVSVPVTATGEKDVGDKAKGVVKLSHQSMSSASVTAGTRLTASSGQVFVTDSSVTIPASSVGPGCFPTACPGATTVSVTAEKPGASYNAASGSLSGTPSGVSAAFTGPTGGGTDKVIKVVTREDVDKVSGDAIKPEETEQAKNDLAAEFGHDFVVLESTFKSDTGELSPKPGIDQEAPDGKATLSGSITYSLMAVPKSEISKFFDAFFAQQIDGRNDQKVYDNGLDEISFTNVTETGGRLTANISTNGKIGPNIDENKLKDFARGKKFGEIQNQVEQTEGVEGVDVKFSPFWVTKAPDNVDKITVEFKVDGK